MCKQTRPAGYLRRAAPPGAAQVPLALSTAGHSQLLPQALALSLSLGRGLWLSLLQSPRRLHRHHSALYHLLLLLPLPPPLSPPSPPLPPPPPPPPPPPSSSSSSSCLFVFPLSRLSRCLAFEPSLSISLSPRLLSSPSTTDGQTVSSPPVPLHPSLSPSRSAADRPLRRPLSRAVPNTPSHFPILCCDGPWHRLFELT
ncbi:hypothetical protein CDD83_5112 [Cordyceps sp. RAO-2017]|nr:hypothetical protein CDD83_5112 [Cordyceps sp. RAO-2017]